MSMVLNGEFDWQAIRRELADIGGTSIALLSEGDRLALLEEAERYSYHPEPESVGSGDRIVRQQMGSKSDFPHTSLYFQLRDQIQRLLDEKTAGADPAPFEIPLRFNDLSLQNYRAGSLGITPHRDGSKFINLICIVVIGGQAKRRAQRGGRFFICDDRSGRGAKEVDASPGRAILLRAPGFKGIQDRPFHFITEIRAERYSLGIRQRRKAG
jgi:hypothetical protein